MLFIILLFNPTISAVDEEHSSDSEVPQFAVELLVDRLQLTRQKN